MTLSPYIKIRSVHPDLILLLVVSWVILRGLEEGLAWALVGGLSLDLLSGAPFGIFSLVILLSVLVAHAAHGRIIGNSLILPLGLTFPLSFLFNGLALLLLALLGRPIAWDAAFTYVLVPTALYNTGVMLFIFPLLSFLNNRWLQPHALSF